MKMLMKNLVVVFVIVLSLGMAASVFAAEASSKPAVTRSTVMQYDALNRLTNIVYSNGYRETYTFDPAGNRTRRQSFGPVEITAATNRVVMAGRKTEIPFELRHVDVTNITVRATASNPEMMGTNDLAILGTGKNRLVAVNPKPGVTGQAKISLVATDGFVSRTNQFNIVVKQVRQQY